MKRPTSVLLALALALALPTAARAAEAVVPPDRAWPWEGLFGTFDVAQLQRGLEVFRAQCVNCHGLEYVRFRDLEAIGFSEEEVKQVAAQYTVPGDPDEFGDPTTRAALPHDAFPDPYPNEQAARAANGGAPPPDLSLMAKARLHGADYIYALLALGYEADAQPNEDGVYHNTYKLGGTIAMAPPLFPDLVQYRDGTEATVDQMAQDISAFLAWAAEPKLEARKAMGLRVVLFLLVLTGLLYVCKRKVWANVEH